MERGPEQTLVLQFGQWLIEDEVEYRQGGERGMATAYLPTREAVPGSLQVGLRKHAFLDLKEGVLPSGS